MKEHRMAAQSCPGCGAHLDAATGVLGDEGPRKDDLTICVYCAGLLRFSADGGLELLRGAERLVALENPEVRRTMLAVAMMALRLDGRVAQ